MVIYFHKRGQTWSLSYGSWITTSYAIVTYHHLHFDFEYCSWRGVPDTTLYDKVSQ